MYIACYFMYVEVLFCALFYEEIWGNVHRLSTHMVIIHIVVLGNEMTLKKSINL